jgi:hypothetical protein
MHKCAISGKTIPEERVEALKMLGVPEDQWTCVEHSMAKPKRGVYLGEAGTSELLMVSKVYDDSVRSIFSSTKEYETDDGDGNTQESEDVKPVAYSSKEMNYYMQAEENGDLAEEVKIIKKRDV